ncbi:MAG TPA: hypothetical protein VE961_09955 [Pyrinomonadaceae bacterium]|nr:hypothetical protein [Pyrinomonadaceae bacterium]
MPCLIYVSLRNVCGTVCVFSSRWAPGSLTAIVWAKDNKTFEYIIAGPSRTSLWRQSIATDKPSLVAELGNQEIQEFAWSPDGKTVAFIRGQWISDAVLIEGLK